MACLLGLMLPFLQMSRYAREHEWQLQAFSESVIYKNMGSKQKESIRDSSAQPPEDSPRFYDPAIAATARPKLENIIFYDKANALSCV